MRSLLVALAILAITSATAAHLAFPDVRGERLVELRLDRDPVQLEYRLGFGPEAAAEARRAADADGDLRVSAAEGARALDARTARLLATLTICAGASLEELACRKLALTDVARVAAEGWEPGPPGDLHLAWTLELGVSPGQVGALRVSDASHEPDVELTEVSFQPPEGRALDLAGELGTRAVARRLTWIEASRAPGPRVVVVARPLAPSRAPWILSGLAVAAALATLLAYARARSRRPTVA
ncbi:MAG: hypothetical protein OZ921_12495 [Sorangiineae bacterium]|nr:hypothetical protein [Polyangiaceae bacterium]MEB2323326.1 hypothetical protein [Sorangiineae bacterium]